jgi:hypothetical protein
MDSRHRMKNNGREMDVDMLGGSLIRHGYMTNIWVGRTLPLCEFVDAGAYVAAGSVCLRSGCYAQHQRCS